MWKTNKYTMITIDSFHNSMWKEFLSTFSCLNSEKTYAILVMS